MGWPAHLIHFVDFEGSLGSGILEYGVVSLQDGGVVGAATRLCQPQGRIRPEDAALHGLSEAELADAVPFSEEFEQFARWRETGPMGAHFAAAENTLIKSVWAYPRGVPDFVRPGQTVADWGPWIDTGRLYAQLYPQLASAKLGELVATFGLQRALDEAAAQHCPPARRRYHAALYDALAGALLLGRLATEPAVAAQSLGWLITMSTLDAGKRGALQQRDLF